MKQFRVLFIMFTLMAFMTGFGKTTADPKQNSKIEVATFDFIKVVPTTLNVVSFDFVANDSISFSGINSTKAEMGKPNCVTFSAIITDVGWRNYKRNYKKLAYNEKVLSLKDLYHKNKNSLRTNRIREGNPFKNEMVFNYTILNC